METDAPTAKVGWKRPEAKEPIAAIEEILKDDVANDKNFEPKISIPAMKGRGRAAKNKY